MLFRAGNSGPCNTWDVALSHNVPNNRPLNADYMCVQWNLQLTFKCQFFYFFMNAAVTMESRYLKCKYKVWNWISIQEFNGNIVACIMNGTKLAQAALNWTQQNLKCRAKPMQTKNLFRLWKITFQFET